MLQRASDLPPVDVGGRRAYKSARFPLLGERLGAIPMAMHYPRRVSRIKKKRSQGFRARMKTKSGRKIINGRRKIGRHLKFA